MARCMLCSTEVGAHDSVCPHCGGAVTDDGVPDPTVVAAAGAGSDPGADPTRVQGGDAAPWDAPTTAEPLPGGDLWIPPSAAADAPPSWGAPPSGPPPGYGGPDAPGAGGYGPGPFGAPPPADAGYGTSPDPGPSPAGYGGPGFGPTPGAGAYGGYGPTPGAYGGYTPYGAPASSGYGAYPGFTPKAPTDGLAVGAFITSLAGLVLAAACGFPILACPVGAVLGHVSLNRIARTGAEGRGFALAGIIIGWIGTGLIVLGIAILIAVAVAGS